MSDMGKKIFNRHNWNNLLHEMGAPPSTHMQPDKITGQHGIPFYERIDPDEKGRVFTIEEVRKLVHAGAVKDSIAILKEFVLSGAAGHPEALFNNDHKKIGNKTLTRLKEIDQVHQEIPEFHQYQLAAMLYMVDDLLKKTSEQRREDNPFHLIATGSLASVRGVYTEQINHLLGRHGQKELKDKDILKGIEKAIKTIARAFDLERDPKGRSAMWKVREMDAEVVRSNLDEWQGQLPGDWVSKVRKDAGSQLYEYYGPSA